MGSAFVGLSFCQAGVRNVLLSMIMHALQDLLPTSERTFNGFSGLGSDLMYSLAAADSL